MSKFSKKKKGMAPINTASLPDIVFMLLFFFMVATTLRETTILVKNKLPDATEVKKLEEKRLIMTIYVGEARDESLGTGDKIQLNDKIATIRDVKRFVDASRKKVPEEDQSYMTTLIKGDINSSVGTINDIKKELRDVNALKITYATGLARE